MIHNVSGNLLAADVQALVNTVNTVGVMGKGIALQFKNAYPAMFKEYARACKAGEVRLGQVHVWETGLLDGPGYIINFPTKGHWRAPSTLRDVEAGLTDLVDVVRRLGITSIAVPPLGAGNGGLDWNDVEPRIRSAFAGVADVDVQLYSPTYRPRAVEMTHAGERPRLTPGRAALIVLVAEYERYALGATPLELQKLMYFLQHAGERLSLDFQAHRYGPYADALRHVLAAVEGFYVTGYGDASAPALQAEQISVLPEAEPAARAMLAGSPETTERVDRVIRLAAGFASMYGLELLATVHWCARQPAVAGGVDDVVSAVHQWSARKRDIFTDHHVRVAWSALHAQGWLAPMSA